MKRYGKKTVAAALLLIVVLLVPTYGVWGKNGTVIGESTSIDQIVQTHAVIAMKSQEVEISGELFLTDGTTGNVDVTVEVLDGVGYSHNDNTITPTLDEGTLTVNFNAKVGDTVSGPFELKVDIVEEREVFFTYTGNMNFAEGNLNKWVTEGAAEFNIASSGLEGYKGNAVTVISGDEASILKTDGPVFRGLEGREYRIRFYGSHSEGNGSINAEFLRYDEEEKNDFIEEADETGDDAVQLAIDSDQWQVYETGKARRVNKDKPMGIRFSFDEPGEYGLSRISIVETLREPVIHEMSMYYVDGNVTVNKSGKGNTAAGTMENPFKSIEQALTVMKAGDSLEIREGNYLEEIHISNLYGTPSFPIVITPYGSEQVTMDGTVEINTDWTGTDTEHLYKTILEEDIWQLFKNDMIQTAGRFPNASWEDDSIFKLKQSTRQIKPYDSSFGYTVDARPSNAGHTSDDNYDEGADFGTIGEDENLIALSDNGVDYTGSVAVLHMGSWLSWANIISEHTPGSGTFTYDTTDFSRSGPIMGSNVYKFAGREAFWDKKNNQHSEGFYFLEGLACVDTDGEWYYTPEDKSLYVYSSQGEPTGSYKGKVQTYAIALEHSSHVTVSGLDFFGTTVSFKESTDMQLENSDFLYPSYNKMVLGDFRRPDVTQMKADKYTVSSNSIINCTFEYMDGPALELSGQNNLVDNSYMSHIDYTTLGTGAEGTINMIDSWFVTFSNNTVHTAGNSEGIRVGKGSKIINNHVYNMSLIQHDGSLINVGAKDDMQKNTVISGNWSHDSYKASVRFDSANMGNPDTVLYGQYGTIADNIVWNAGPIKVKGNNHTVTGNVGFAPKSAMSIAILDNPSMGGFNDGTVTSGNAGILSSSFGSVISTLPGTATNNIDAEPMDMVRDFSNWDFRPIEGSELDLSGVGPYTTSGVNYRIPGYKASSASIPIPKDGGEGLVTSDLMWQGAYEGTAYDVYFGESADALSHMGRQPNNIYTPAVLELDKTYYWRVDTVMTDGSVVAGDVWNFTVKEKTVEEETPEPELVNMLLNPGFEEGTASWIKIGKSATLNAEVTEVYEGDASVRVGDRGIGTTSKADGIAQNVTFEKGHTYRVSAYMKSTVGEQDAFIRTAVKDSATNKVINTVVAGGKVNPDTWTQVTGEFEFTGEGPFSFMRLKLDVFGTDDFYIDQVELYDITGETEEPLPEVELMNGDFEDGTKYWANHGCSFEADTTVVKNGAASLRIFDRNNDSTGPAQYMDIAPGRKYNVSMSVKLADGIGTAYFRYVYADKTKRPDAIIAAIDSADGWVELSGVLDLSEETEGLGTRPFIKLFVEDTEAAPWVEVQEYWIDDVVIEAVE